MAQAFEQADLIEIYAAPFGRLPPRELASAKLGELRRNAQPEQWPRLTAAVRDATGGDQALAIWSLGLRLRRGGRELGLAHLFPPSGELAMRIAGRDYGRVWAGPAFRETFEPFENQLQARLLKDIAPAKNGRPSQSKKPLLPSFDQVKFRMIQLFENAEYANLLLPTWKRGVEGVETLGRHREAWRLMTQGVREASPGYPLSAWPPDYWITPIPPRRFGWAALRDYELLYKNGILYCEAKELGGMVRTLKPSGSFDQGLQVLAKSLRPESRGASPPR
jgi:hypothetical protein